MKATKLIEIEASRDMRRSAAANSSIMIWIAACTY
jgi:hypothetical protein